MALRDLLSVTGVWLPGPSVAPPADLFLEASYPAGPLTLDASRIAPVVSLMASFPGVVALGASAPSATLSLAASFVAAPIGLEASYLG